MKRRDMLLSTAALGLSAFPLRWVAAAEKKPQKMLYFTRSAGYEHSVVRREGDQLAHSEKVLTEMGRREDVWTNPIFQQIALGGIAWALGNVEADITPNIAQVTTLGAPRKINCPIIVI